MMFGRIVAVMLLGAATVTGGPARLAVTVRVGPDDASLHGEQATLVCDGSAARGTGSLAPRARARRACDVVRAGRVQRVARAQTSRRMCPMIYGGPQTARLRGTIADRRIDLKVTRSDGCGVSDWRRLQALLGDPERLAAPVSATARGA